MELQSTIEAVRALLRQGDTGAALETLRLYLEEQKPPGLHATLEMLHGLEARFGAVRQKEFKGLIAPQDAQREYNQINDALLGLLTDMQSGKTPVSAASRRRRKVWAVAAVALVAIVTLVLFVFKNKEHCPDFSGANGLRVMILPFQKVGGNDQAPEIVLQKVIRQRTGDNQLPVKVEVYTSLPASRRNPDHADAAQMGRDCGADLVIWGIYATDDSTRVDINYVFAQNESNSVSTGFQAFGNITELQSGALVKRTLDDAIFSVCALMAIRADNMPLAKKWLEKIKEPNAREAALLTRVNENLQ